MRIGTEILVLGGGATGLAVAWDCALRGFKTVLLEKGDLAHGTSGRYHGLLHSGGRYAVRDRASARDCMAENLILRRLFPAAIEDTGGLFVVTPNDPPEYANPWMAACADAGIAVEEISAATALREEPLLNPRISRAFRVPDAACDSFDLLHLMAGAVREAGGEVYTRKRVERLIAEQGRVLGAVAEDVATGERLTVLADLVVNCTGAWAGQIAGLAGCELKITPGKGTMIAMNLRLANTVINRCHPPDDGDILVPVGTVSVIGTTEVVVDSADRYAIEAWEVEKMLAEGEILVPRLRDFRALRAWAGVRPLFRDDRPAPGNPGAAPPGAQADSRLISRAHSILDHATRDGVEGLVSVVGGKLTTCRLMAEQAADMICRKLEVSRPCRTASASPASAADPHHVHGRRLKGMESRGGQAGRLEPGEEMVCECELVSRAQVEAALHESGSPVLNDLRRDLRLGMGPCQAGFCAYRATGLLYDLALQPQADTPELQANGAGVEQANSALLEFLQERWKGLRPVMWGANLKQIQLDLNIYRGVLAADRLPAAREVEAYPTERTA